jgi:RNA polymerase sigma-70 factor, ECF subfamily
MYRHDSSGSRDQFMDVQTVPCHFCQFSWYHFGIYRTRQRASMRELKRNSAGCLSLNQAIRLVHQGDPKAFEFIYRSYCGLVHRICLRMLRNPVDAEDAAQDVFVRVFCKINTFRGESAFSSWLYRLATNTVLMRFRKNKRTLTLEEPGEVNGGLSREVSVTHPERDGLSGRIDLQAAINVLPNGYKGAFLLHDVQGYAHREIAEILGYSIGCSKSQLHKARKLLRELLRDMPKNRVPQDTKPPSVFVR